MLSDYVFVVTWSKEDVQMCDWKHKSEFKFVELQNFKMTLSRFLREEFEPCKLIDVLFFLTLQIL